MCDIFIHAYQVNHRVRGSEFIYLLICFYLCNLFFIGASECLLGVSLLLVFCICVHCVVPVYLAFCVYVCVCVCVCVCVFGLVGVTPEDFLQARRL